MIFEAFEPRVVWQVLKGFEIYLKRLLISITVKHVILIENIKIQKDASTLLKWVGLADPGRHSAVGTHHTVVPTPASGSSGPPECLQEFGIKNGVPNTR